ncbi:MAG: hypothetical protein ACI9F9_002312 [Candidatus Paceibacteria bacterium]|jgi:hypothetical protein
MSRSNSFRTSILAIGCGTIIAGTVHAQNPVYDITGNVANDHLGFSVANAGDMVNADGMNDILVGAPEDGALLNPQEGYVSLVSGLNGSVVHTWHGDVAGDLFGFSVAGDADVDGDGTPDVIAGAPYHTNVQSADGLVRVLSGATKSELFTVYGDQFGQQLGRQVTGCGDLNGDGRF